MAISGVETTTFGSVPTAGENIPSQSTSDSAPVKQNTTNMHFNFATQADRDTFTRSSTQGEKIATSYI